MNISKEELLQEEEHLDKTLTAIRETISALGQELHSKQEKVMEFKKLMWDSKHEMDPGEMLTIMTQSDLEINFLTYKSKKFQTFYRIQDKPYFGAITFEEEESDANKIYIGITHVEKEDEYLVHDWRAPICSIFYDFEVGKAQYLSPGGIIKGELLNKRQFTIQEGKLIRAFDHSLNISDDVLQQVLTQKSGDKMKNIVNTIQQEQNRIIRNEEDKVLIVQGIAGSGKTSVALHRIAFMLYKIKNLNSNNVLIFSPNNVFSEYISNVLPELGEANTLQTTFSDFLYSNLLEFKKVESFTGFIERYYKYQEKNKELVKYKQSDKIIDDLEDYVNAFVEQLHFIEDIIVDKDVTISKEELNDLFKDRYSKLYVNDRLREMSNKLCRDHFQGKRTNFLKILSLIKKSLNVKINFKQIFKNFFLSEFFYRSFKQSILEKDLIKIINSKSISYEDACIFVYIKGLLEGFSYKGLIKEVVIDEAQDYNLIQYKIIKKVFAKSGFTILGDINQTINPYYKYDTLEILSTIFDNDGLYLELSKTYRSTPEIIEYTNKILGLTHVSAIRKENNKPILFREEKNNLKEKLIEDIEFIKKNKFSYAIITKTDEEAKIIYDLLKEDIRELTLLSDMSETFNNKAVILPSYTAKGLEFDATIVYTPKENAYKKEEKHLYYVACTRAQHQLIIYNQKNI